MSANPRRKSLIQYWSIRYFLVILIATVLVLAAALFIIDRSSSSEQHRDMQFLVQEIGAKVVENGGLLPEYGIANYLVNEMQTFHLSGNPLIYLLNQDGQIVQQYPQEPLAETKQLMTRIEDIMTGEPHIITLDHIDNRPPYLAAIHPIPGNGGHEWSYVAFLIPEINVLEGLLEFKLLRWMSFAVLLLIGWAMIYQMTRKLVHPIQETVDAAKQIVAGNYDVQLQEENSQREVHELILAFREMAERLSRLEALRAQLLAGVTHELKTPITSISGMIQAVNEGVVTGDEAQAFLDNCLKQTSRLQKMVEDILDFNSFTSNSVAVRKELFNLQDGLQEIINRWLMIQDRQGLVVEMAEVDGNRSWTALSDPARLEQILVNLLNNARDAIVGEGVIRIYLTLNAGEFHIAVEDTGQGIRSADRDHIFEQFYRGANKKRIHGLGLGLPYSKRIARSLGGDLVLTSSTPKGTVFTLSIPA